MHFMCNINNTFIICAAYVCVYLCYLIKQDFFKKMYFDFAQGYTTALNGVVRWQWHILFCIAIRRGAPDIYNAIGLYTIHTFVTCICTYIIQQHLAWIHKIYFLFDLYVNGARAAQQYIIAIFFHLTRVPSHRRPAA